MPELLEIFMFVLLPTGIFGLFSIFLIGRLRNNKPRKAAKDVSEQEVKAAFDLMKATNDNQRLEIKRLTGAVSKFRSLRDGGGDNEQEATPDLSELKPLLEGLGLPAQLLDNDRVKEFLGNSDNVQLIKQLGPIIAPLIKQRLGKMQQGSNNDIANEYGQDVKSFA